MLQTGCVSILLRCIPCCHGNKAHLELYTGISVQSSPAERKQGMRQLLTLHRTGVLGLLGTSSAQPETKHGVWARTFNYQDWILLLKGLDHSVASQWPPGLNECRAICPSSISSISWGWLRTGNRGRTNSTRDLCRHWLEGSLLSSLTEVESWRLTVRRGFSEMMGEALCGP